MVEVRIIEVFFFFRFEETDSMCPPDGLPGERSDHRLDGGRPGRDDFRKTQTNKMGRGERDVGRGS